MTITQIYTTTIREFSPLVYLDILSDRGPEFQLIRSIAEYLHYYDGKDSTVIRILELGYIIYAHRINKSISPSIAIKFMNGEILNPQSGFKKVTAYSPSRDRKYAFYFDFNSWTSDSYIYLRFRYYNVSTGTYIEDKFFQLQAWEVSDPTDRKYLQVDKYHLVDGFEHYGFQVNTDFNIVYSGLEIIVIDTNINIGYYDFYDNLILNQSNNIENYNPPIMTITSKEPDSSDLIKVIITKQDVGYTIRTELGDWEYDWKLYKDLNVTTLNNDNTLVNFEFDEDYVKENPDSILGTYILKGMSPLIKEINYDNMIVPDIILDRRNELEFNIDESKKWLSIMKNNKNTMILTSNPDSSDDSTFTTIITPSYIKYINGKEYPSWMYLLDHVRNNDLLYHDDINREVGSNITFSPYDEILFDITTKISKNGIPIPYKSGILVSTYYRLIFTHIYSTEKEAHYFISRLSDLVNSFYNTNSQLIDNTERVGDTLTGNVIIRLDNTVIYSYEVNITLEVTYA